MRFVILCLSFCLAACVRTVEVPSPTCPVGIMYLTENDRQTISDMLVEEILAYNLFCERIGKGNEIGNL